MQSDSTTINPYLQQEVLTASPIRLRWMLVNRAEELCGLVGQMWSSGEKAQASQWIIRLREILGELLEGVHDRSNPLSKDVTDFYIFLLQMLAEVEQSQSQPRLKTLRDLLKYEADTWQMVLEKNAREASGTSVDSFRFETPSQSRPLIPSTSESLSSDGFSLEV